MPHPTLRKKLIFSFSLVIIVGVLLSAYVAIHLIGSTVLQQAQDKVRLDLNSAREVYNEECEYIKHVVRLTAIRYVVKDALLANNRERLRSELNKIKRNESLDFLTLTDDKGRIILRTNGGDIRGEKTGDALVNKVLSEKKEIASTAVISAEELEQENKNLVEQARIKILPTPKARPGDLTVETSGMVIKAAAPVTGYAGELIGVLYGGKLLNKNFDIVDKAKNIVYRGEQYNGKDIGTVTIFLGDLRISTNVRNTDGSRAIGTRVSQEVYEQVILKGIPWIGRAFVVNAWYRTAYEPVRNINDEIIGMLYVGMLEAPWVDLRNRIVYIFLGIAASSIFLLLIISYLTTSSIIKPLKKLLAATEKVAQGDLSHRITIKSEDELGKLAESFNRMTEELQKATEGYLSCTRTLEDKVEEKTKELKEAQNLIIQSEKLTSLGKLAAGIAHEINNPLTSILINSNLISEKAGDNEKLKENLQLIIDETARCSKIVTGLLEFSRQTQPEKRMVDINTIIEKTLLLFESQVLVNKVTVEKKLDKDLPFVMVDDNKIKQVFTNLILNSIEAMPEGGTLLLQTNVSGDGKFIEIITRDTGCGISKEHISKIFDPFFSTKGMKGTGLGLSVTYGIIEQHNGTINVESEEGKGTKFTIRLPADETTKRRK